MLCVDAVILLAWMVADFPAPTTETTTATEFIGKVDHVSCHSSSFIFSALLIFWKAIITFGGVYVSFLIRDAGSDFQESVWIFASSCVVLLVALILLPLAFAVELPPATAYSFQSIVLLVGTMAVMGLMLGPKFYRLNAQDKSSTSTKGGTKGGTSTARTSSIVGSRVHSRDVSDQPSLK
ncbi:Aste57867_3606 [Aphanomyces stellatus]|uniref:Aste57867_3606 protein n=1 Tax=Aphanomyces stellatus TaxID=120398 RepID=A0A485KFI4_9STRA|nr:hypothetical protein As57867_003595 [Aphanomyces stellatus]VFT80767.1 Aste57867_3606 [Aphanomyces stellatus]